MQTTSSFEIGKRSRKADWDILIPLYEVLSTYLQILMSRSFMLL